jgi:hypothetical protein
MTSVGTWAIWTAGDPLLDLAVDRAQLSWGDDDGGLRRCKQALQPEIDF